MASKLSAYELQRQANMDANRKHLLALGIEKLVQPVTVKRAVKGAAANKREKREVVPPRQPSLRQRNLDIDGKQMEEKPEVPVPEPREAKRQRKSGPLDAAKVTAGKTDESAARAFFDAVCPALDDVAPPPKPDAADALAASLGGLSVAEDDVAKLVPERIFSLTVHPSASKLLVVAGDTWGRIGLWDVDQPADDDDAPCVVTFETHSRPVKPRQSTAGRRASPLRLPIALSFC